MKILVIGNGFDLEHGLPTKYKDFLDFMKAINLLYENKKSNKIIADNMFCSELEEKVNHEVDNNVKKYFCDRELVNFSFFNKWSEEENAKELIDCANNNIWIKYFLENMNYEKEGWIDFESEISYVIQCFDYTKNLSEYLMKYNEWPIDRNRDKYKENIVQKIIKYSDLKIEVFELRDKKLKKIINVLNEHLNNLIRCLEIYLEEFVGQIDIKYVSPNIKDIEFDKVLSFNYTNTYEKVYASNNDEIEYDYIHGKANITSDDADNNMVLGIDEYLNNNAKNKELEFIAFKKYFQRIYKKTGNDYKKWIKEINKCYKEIINQSHWYDEKVLNSAIIEDELKNNRNEIYVFGHSLDITDKDIIKELIKCRNTITTIFYYDKDVYAQQIANLVKIIGQDELIKRVSGATPTIIFNQQSKRINRNV